MNVGAKIGLWAAGIIGTVVVAIIGVGFFLSPQSQLHNADVIVAISGGETRQRTAEAVRLYNKGYAHKLLFSGAAADRNGPSNAAAMRNDAIEDGVPERNILIEEGSATTAENAVKSAPILRGLNAHTIILVTSPYHQRRASLNFRQILGPNVTILNHSSIDSVWRKSSWWRQPKTIWLTVGELQKTVYVWSTKPQTN